MFGWTDGKTKRDANERYFIALLSRSAACSPPSSSSLNPNRPFAPSPALYLADPFLDIGFGRKRRLSHYAKAHLSFVSATVNPVCVFDLEVVARSGEV